MFRMPLGAFTQDESFPFYIHFGEHEDAVFLHGHDNYFELVIVMSGQAVHIVDGERYRIEKGDVFVIGPDTEHGYEAPENFHICNVMFRARFLDLQSYDIAQTPGFQALFVLEPQRSRSAHFTSHLKLSATEFRRIGDMLHRLCDEYYGREAGWKTMVRADFLRLAVTLSRLYDTDKIGTGAGIVKLAPALAYIETHYQEELSVAALAAMSHYSDRQFIRLFREATGCLPLQYITRLRMQHAQELLRSTDLSVSEVAACCGYPDSSYFSRLFRRLYGITPRRYRQM
ncbi:MAG: helix-turn-helix domain-containing protein [Oscillospiraceae bacterium]|nr:helix-turn-helix domain-containing protein [Oscillospiraceae bacterium]